MRPVCAPNRLPIERARWTKRLTTDSAASASVGGTSGSAARINSRMFAVESAGSAGAPVSSASLISRLHSRSHSSLVCAANHNAAAVNAR